MNQIIEVKIKKLKINYIATCVTFPECKGIGKTKETALKSLSKSISKHISEMIQSSLNAAFKSNNYTQILVDQTTEPHEETIGFNLSSKTSLVPKNILFKVPMITEEYDEEEEDEKDLDSYEDHLFSTTLKSDDNVMDNDMFEQLTFRQKSTQDAESIVFGFPLNFN